MGVKFDNEQQRFVFDFEHDGTGDIVSLTGDGYEVEAPAAEVDITGETDENGEAEIVLEGDGWEIGFEFGNPESGEEVAPEEGTPEEETTEGSPTDIEESNGDGQ